MKYILYIDYSASYKPMTAEYIALNAKTIAEAIPDLEYFTVQQAADLTGTHIHTIQARLRDGTLKGKKLGGKWKIYRESLFNVKVDADLNTEKR